MISEDEDVYPPVLKALILFEPLPQSPLATVTSPKSVALPVEAISIVSTVVIWDGLLIDPKSPLVAELLPFGLCL